MIKRFFNLLKFYVERLFLRGPHYRLLFIAIIIIIVTLIAASLVYISSSFFNQFGEAVWWAFMHLIDPGYISSDQGTISKSVSVILIIFGYVIFMGALIAIMTQWLHSSMKKLESGLTPITQNNHIIILGWTNRSSAIIRELLLSEGRVKRFLAKLGAGSLHIVILAEDVTMELVNNLKEELGSIWEQKKITLRSGTPLRIEHLKRVDFMHAGVIIIPGADYPSEGSDRMDSRVIKTILSINNYGEVNNIEGLPVIVAELQDFRKIPLAKNPYKGEVEIVAGDAVISRLIAQNIRHKGLSYIYSELLQHNEGNEFYIRECSSLDGENFYRVADAFPSAVLIGVLRKDNGLLKPYLNPPMNFIIQKDDQLVFIAEDYESTEPPGNFTRNEIKNISRQFKRKNFSNKKILILGWNHKFPSLIKELECYEETNFIIDNLSGTLIDDRLLFAERYQVIPDKIKITYKQGDYTAPPDLIKLNPSSYDVIIFLGSIRFEGVEESDARTLLGYFVLRDILQNNSTKPEIIIELMHPENEKLFRNEKGEVLISPLILSHMLAHVALRKDLNIVFEELFGSSGAEIEFHLASEYNFSEKEITFSEIQKNLLSTGIIPIGIKIFSKNKIFLNPSRKVKWALTDKDEVIVISN
jgi:hypothetical protein